MSAAASVFARAALLRGLLRQPHPRCAAAPAMAASCVASSSAAGAPSATAVFSARRFKAHRAAHRLWKIGRKALALFLQSRVSEVFAVDIHPGARIGKGILIDHATGLVVGETAVIGDNVSILHNVTLGGTGKESGDRHPKIGDGVLVGAGTQILGNVRIGEGAKVGAGSVVLKDVPARTTAVGNPAKLVGGKENPMKLDKMPSLTMDHTSWSDYVI